MFKPLEKKMENTVSQEPTSNQTGIPDALKQRFELKSKLSMDAVRVHYNSDKPGQLSALAYTQGSTVYIGPGQEKHLPHELGHVVQQMQGRVHPTRTVSGFPVNDQPHLEAEADCLSAVYHPLSPDISDFHGGATIQRIEDLGDIAQERFASLASIAGVNAALGVAPPNLNYFTSRGIPPALSALFIPGTPNPYLFVLQAIRDYYSTAVPVPVILPPGAVPWPIPIMPANLQVALGADVGNIDPATAHANQQAPLNFLITALNLILLPQVQVAITAGQTFRATLGNASPAGGAASPVPTGAGGAGVAGLNWRANVGYTATNNHQDILEGTARFNALVQPDILQAGNLIGPQLPNVNIGSIPFGGQTAVGANDMGFGLAVGPSQVEHEMGHHLENHLGVNDLATMHNFLRARTRPANNGNRDSGWGLFGDNPMGTFGTGYNAELPPMKFQNPISREMSSGNGLIRFGLFNMGNWLLSSITRPFNPERGQRFVDDFFLQESNSEKTSYATLSDGNGSTEFLSTTAELLSTHRGAQELINRDPTRAAMFVYLANKPMYNAVSFQFALLQAAGPFAAAPAIPLDTFIHVL